MRKNPSVTTAFKTYYNNVLSKEHNNPELIARWGEHPSTLETQVNCKPGGVKIGDSNMFEECGEVFGPVRWPYNSRTEPNYSDPPVKFSIPKRIQAIGTSWWDWRNKRSIGVGFDFDSLLDHNEDVGISPEEIEKLDNIDVPWLEVIRSTRGNGRHVYIWFKEPYPIANNHVEHSAVARSLIPLIAEHTGLNIDTNVDCKGLIMWIWHVNMTKENRGYELVKPATQHLTADHIPPNWRDHIEVTSGGRSKVRVKGWDANGEETKGDELDEMTQAVAEIPLDETHLKILEELEGTGHTALWVHDHHIFQGHTAGLKYVYDSMKEKGTPLRGLFDSNTLDSDPGKPNCFGGDTKVITREGVKPIKDLAGKNVEIITRRGVWTKAPFKSYGVQDVCTVTLRRGKDTKAIKATRDHRWFVCESKNNDKIRFDIRKEVITDELQKRQVLVQLRPTKRAAPSIIGIQHGLVWGDGTHGGKYKTSVLPLYGDKDATLLRFFTGHPRRTIYHSVGGTVITNLPYHFKSLVPLHYDNAYLYGWLAGYFAADGCAEENGRCRIVSASLESIEHVKQVCHILGIETSRITARSKVSNSTSSAYSINLKAYDLEKAFFLIPKHRKRWSKWMSKSNKKRQYWRVESVVPAEPEEVFCCEVPKTHCFCLEDFILVGNCFMRPKPNGAFDVYRFGEGTTECPLWDAHGKWTHIAYNSPATLKQICLASDGYEGTDEKQGYLFDSVEDLQAALKLLKAENTNLPDNIEGRTLSLHTKGKQTVLVIEKKSKDEKKDFPRYVKTSRGWEIILSDAVETPDEDIENEMMWSELDDQFRALQVKAGRSYKFDSWALKNDESEWVEHPRENIKSYLSQTCPKVDPILGSAIFKAWTLVKHPFQPEYPGGRLWNRDGAQFRYDPVELNEGEHPVHPTWTRVMEHCGMDLNEYIAELPWCQDWNIRTGGDYLTAWIACMFQNPYGKLPYLFMYGPQNCGKSSFHEALEFLLTRGVAKADRALTSAGGFNSELEEAILAVIDEVDVARAGSAAYNKIKEWVTGTSISIHPKGGVVRDVLSTLHFVQVSNDRSSLPVFPGDTRITAMSVSGLEEEIPRERLYVLLKEEGPHFMRTLMDYNVPEATGRLMLPIIETRGKLEAADNNIDSLTAFIEENCYEIPGVAIRLTEFQTRFFATLEPHVVEEWQKGRTLQSKLSEHYLLGRCPNLNQTIIGNFTFNKSTKPSARYIRSGKQLRKEGNDV